ncbi:MAG: ABC transporter substrate-binding protein [Candidatus Dormibacteraeota bacterium]|nr:ABC transporter substrate-binding protein [Candidatus Dormibacteraeota bacterium]
MRRLAALVAALTLLAACSAGRPAAEQGALTVGAIYPLSGPQAEGGRQELGGVRAALALAAGRPVHLQVVSVETPDAARAAVDWLIDRYHVPLIVGTYGSTLAEASAARADQRHTVYWETGAVADTVTQDRRYVFRTVATGSTLGRTAVSFTAQVLLHAAGLAPAQARVVIANVDDVYGRSVADGEQELAASLGLPVVDRIQYDPSGYDPDAVARRLATDRPDYLWDVSYIADGVAIWRAALSQGVRLRGAVGTSSAWCMSAFGQQLGKQAVGVFAADKPDARVSPTSLSPAARALLARARAAYGRMSGASDMPIPAVAGFVGGWTLFHDVLPAVRGGVTPDAVRTAAYGLDEAPFTSINGGGVRFAGPGRPDAGQNLLAPSVVGQWQGLEVMRTVYPGPFAEAAPLLGGDRSPAG